MSQQQPKTAEQIPVVKSLDLLKGHREIWIEHAGELYRLRITKAGKLILTK